MNLVKIKLYFLGSSFNEEMKKKEGTKDLKNPAKSGKMLLIYQSKIVISLGNFIHFFCIGVVM